MARHTGQGRDVRKTALMQSRSGGVKVADDGRRWRSETTVGGAWTERDGRLPGSHWAPDCALTAS